MLINTANFLTKTHGSSYVAIACVLSHEVGRKVYRGLNHIQSEQLGLKLEIPIMETFRTGGLHRTILDLREDDLC